MKNPPLIPLRKAIFYIFGSLIFLSGPIGAGLLYMHHIRMEKMRDAKFKIVAISQACSTREALKTVYLAELLDLSYDKPVSLYGFSTREARKKLLANPIIKTAEVEKIKPGTVLINYALRIPIAFLGDFTNTGVDADGYLFPVKPFLSPKKLPILYLGMEQNTLHWGEALQGKKAELALELYELIDQNICTDQHHLLHIDVSNAFALSYGQRQVVVMMEAHPDSRNFSHAQQRFLRLSAENYRQELANYLALDEYLAKQSGVLKPQIIDLRIPHLAYISAY